MKFLPMKKKDAILKIFSINHERDYGIVKFSLIFWGWIMIINVEIKDILFIKSNYFNDNLWIHMLFRFISLFGFIIIFEIYELTIYIHY